MTLLTFGLGDRNYMTWGLGSIDTITPFIIYLDSDVKLISLCNIALRRATECASPIDRDVESKARLILEKVSKSQFYNATSNIRMERKTPCKIPINLSITTTSGIHAA